MRPLARVLIDESHRQAWTTRPEVAATMSPANPADVSYAEAAEVAGCPLGTIRSRVARARDDLVAASGEDERTG